MCYIVHSSNRTASITHIARYSSVPQYLDEIIFQLYRSGTFYELHFKVQAQNSDHCCFNMAIYCVITTCWNISARVLCCAAVSYWLFVPRLIAFTRHAVEQSSHKTRKTADLYIEESKRWFLVCCIIKVCCSAADSSQGRRGVLECFDKESFQTSPCVQL